MTPFATHQHAARLGVVALQQPYEQRLHGKHLQASFWGLLFADSRSRWVCRTSHALFVARGESQGWRKEPAEGSDAMAAGGEGWAVDARSLSLQNQPGGGGEDVLWREEEGKS